MNRDELLAKAANGNAAALGFLTAFARRAHWVDDVVDRDNTAVNFGSPAEHAKREAEWLMTLAGNPFFLANRASLVPAMVVALSAWVDSESITNPHEQAVCKGQWHEVVRMVAWITGGWEGIQRMNFREYDVEKPIHGLICNACGRPIDWPLASIQETYGTFCNEGCRMQWCIDNDPLKEVPNGMLRR